MLFRQRKYRQMVKDQGEDVHGACLHLALPFKDNCLQSQVPTWAFILACTSNQFHSSWRSGPNHTSRIRRGSSLQQKKALAEECSYLATTSFIAFMYKRRDTKTGISSAYTDTFAERGQAKRMMHRAERTFSSLSLLSRGSKART